MINKVLLNKNLPFPHLSFSLILSCLIISIPILFNNVLYAFLAANAGIAFPWQYLTSVFAHGPEPPLIFHLINTLLIIVFCVALAEKLLGTWRTFFVLLLSVIIFTNIRFETLNFYNGFSLFIYSFIPFTIFLTIREVKNSGRLFWNEVFNYYLFVTLMLVLLVYPLYFTFLDTFFCERNVLYLSSLMLGTIFLLLFKKRFIKNINKIMRNETRKIKVNIPDKITRTFAYLITIINFLILLIVLIFYN